MFREGKQAFSVSTIVYVPCKQLYLHKNAYLYRLQKQIQNCKDVIKRHEETIQDLERQLYVKADFKLCVTV